MVCTYILVVPISEARVASPLDMLLSGELTRSLGLKEQQALAERIPIVVRCCW